MCTVFLLHRPGHAWPVMLAANRDEMLERPWAPPAAHWPDHPDIIGGIDRMAGGTWMAINRYGVVSAVLNRVGSLGPAPGKRSRGELPLIALAGRTAAEAADIVRNLDAGQWRPFNMVVADARGGVFLAGLGSGRAEAQVLPAGLSMVTAHSPNDMNASRIARHLPVWRGARAPDSPADWGDWPALLADTGGNRAEQLCLPAEGGFGTVSSSILALSAWQEWHFRTVQPGQTPFRPVALP
ncbi:hypothetical protein EOD42_24695 [Rhodovarius crocodyli]|uniref:NRDE family protein n=1 Tax=Rhodovarius crocodyli TaxID=1979269 RepID=A0A437LX53_9PROT|nr:NRDE family protein [Rhodovarius crocodyli]RVT89964.1 hypothetical protein EOD42_24695 [Rhodovarius crocodyli]